MNFEAVLHYKHQNKGRDELRHIGAASGNSEASNSDSEVDSADHSPVPSPGQKKGNEVSRGEPSPLHNPLLFSSSPRSRGRRRHCKALKCNI